MTIALTASVIVPTVITDTWALTRATTGTYIDASGMIQTAAIDAPRIDYSTGKAQLLVEPAATNLLSYSEQFENAAWSQGLATIAANAANAPNGTVTAEKLVEDSTASNTHSIYRVRPLLALTTYTMSVYAKAGERSQLMAFVQSTGFVDGGPRYCVFDLSSGLSLAPTGAGASAAIDEIGGGWFRCSLTFNGTASASPYIQWALCSGGANVYTGNGTSGLYIWGAQLETSPVHTSYIPTTTTATTRAADVITGSGLIYCTTAEPASGETAWDAATSYTVGQVVVRSTTHKRYENLIAGVNATLPENATTGVTPRWLDLGATNRWSQFDKKIGTATTSTGNLTTVLTPGSVEGLALLDLIGRSADISIKAAPGGAVVYTRTVDLDGSIVGGVYDWMFGDYIQKRNVILTDLPGQYPSMEVTVTVNSTTGSAIGVFAIGRVMTIGVTEYGAGAGIINFGKVADDGFGNRTWIEGQWANRVTLPLVANASDFNRIHRQLAGVRSTPCIYIGSELDSMEPLVCYGVYRDLYITVPNSPTIALNLEIDGMNNQ